MEVLSSAPSTKVLSCLSCRAHFIPQEFGGSDIPAESVLPKLQEQQQFGTCGLGRGTQPFPIRPGILLPARSEMLVLGHTEDRVAPPGSKHKSKAKPKQQPRQK